MKPIDLVTVALGIGSAVIAVFVPATAPILGPTAAGLIFSVVPRPSDLVGNVIEKFTKR